jgi:hypothetical protein
MEMTDSLGDTISLHTDERNPDERLRSKPSSRSPALLERLGILQVQTSIQAGKLVLRRADGDKVNPDFSDFPRPVDAPAPPPLGAVQEMFPFRNMTRVCRRLGSPGRHDACSLPRASRVNGRLLAVHRCEDSVREVSAIQVRLGLRHAELIQEDRDKLMANCCDRPSRRRVGGHQGNEPKPIRDFIIDVSADVHRIRV